MNPRLTMTALSLTVVGVALTACTSSTPAASTAAPRSPKPLSASAALHDSISKLASADYNVTVSGGGQTGKGAVDPSGKLAVMDVSTPIAAHTELKMDTLTSAGQVFLRIDAGSQVDHALHVNPSVWMRIQTAKLHQDVALPLDPDSSSDPEDIGGLIQAVVSVHRTDATHYAGTMDLNQSGGVLSPDQSDLTKAGAKAKAVPFTAVLDTSGRLVSLTVNAAKANKDMSVTVKISDYGTATAVTKPSASSTITTPASVYSMLNS
jgi:hypothetical protein